MSASASVLPPPLDILTDVTPSLPRADRDHAARAAAVLNGRLYVAWLALDDQRQRESRVVLRYSPEAGTWETLYQKTLSAGRARRKKKAKGDKSSGLSVAIRNYGPNEKEVLYVEFVSPLGRVQLYSAEDGAEFRNARADSKVLAAALALREKLTGKADEYALFSIGGRNVLQRRNLQRDSQRWTRIPMPSKGPGAEPPQLSHIASFDGKLTIAIDDSKEGFHLWARNLASEILQEWVSLLRRGGQRYSMNAHVFACVPWKGALYVVSGPGERRSRTDHQVGFEMLRIYLDGSWDLVLGAPRVTGSGLKVPLSCLGPGTDEFTPARFCFLAEAGSELLLGTYEDVAGLQIWQSEDGGSWSVINSAELAGLEKIRSASAFSISTGTALLLEFESSLRGRTFDIWFRPFAKQPVLQRTAAAPGTSSPRYTHAVPREPLKNEPLNPPE
jgi:hypothetical protein